MNPAIAAARRTALDLLQPSQKDLDHGLELHKHSLVVESYSLGLHAPIDADVVNAIREAGGSNSEIQDLIEDQIMTGWARTPELRQEYREAWEASGVTCSFLNAGEEGNSPTQLLKRLARYIYLTEAMPEIVAKVTTPQGVQAAFSAGQRTLCFATNGVPLPGLNSTVEEELSQIRVFAHLGVRSMHLTYNRRNPIGDGCGEEANAGLSYFGQAAVQEMNRLGVLIDLAHTGRQTSLDVCKISSQPVIISHAAAYALQPHIRAKTDEEIRAVIETGGTMGLTNVPAFLGRKGDINAFLDHIDYVAKTFGADAVTIGTDASYKSYQRDSSDTKLKPSNSRRARWESVWPERDPLAKDLNNQTSHQLQSLVWTNFPLFTVGLVQRGHSDEAIQKILGGNMLRVFQQAWSDSALNPASAG